MSRTWEDNAAEFGALSKQGVDVRLAVLVATSVEKMEKGKGGDPDTLARSSKGSANAFAKQADTTKDRVIRHLDAWIRCAAEGWCEVPTALDPEDALDSNLKVPTEEQFKDKFDASGSGGRPRASVKEIVARAERDEEYAEELTREVAKVAPKAAAKAATKNKAVRTEIAEADKAEVEDRLKKQGLIKHTGSKTPEGKAVEATVAARNAVSDWLILVHEASVKLHAAAEIWEKVEDSLVAGDLFEANASLTEAEADAVVLRQRVADRHNALSGTSV